MKRNALVCRGKSSGGRCSRLEAYGNLLKNAVFWCDGVDNPSMSLEQFEQMEVPDDCEHMERYMRYNFSGRAYTLACTVEDLNPVTDEQFREIMGSDNECFSGDGIWEGIKIIKKYLPDARCIVATTDDTVHSVDPEELIQARITVADVWKLRNFGWDIHDYAENLSCSV